MAEEEKKSVNIDYYIEMLLKRRWFIIIPFCISMVIGITLSIKLPRKYMAISSILVEPQRVPAKYVQPLMDSDLEDRMVTLQEQVLSQTNLEEIINKFSMFKGEKYAKMFLEDKIGSLRKQITVKITKARRGADAFSIAFEGGNPEMVMNVVNTLTSSFIDKNLELRESKAIGTVEFLDGQLADMRRKLTDVEEKVKEFRKAHMGELPEQLSSNEKILDRLQLKMVERRQSLRDAKNRLAELEKETKSKLSLLEDQMEVQRNVLSISPDKGGEEKIAGGDIPSSTSADVEKLSVLRKFKEQYDGALLRYTARHPDVLKLKKMMTDLEADIVREEERRKAEEKKKPKPSAPEKPVEEKDMMEAAIEEQKKSSENMFSQEFDSLRKNLRQESIEKNEKLSQEIAAIEEEIAKMDKDAKEYDRRVDVTPKRDQEMMSLMRDYLNIQKYYSELLNRKLEADIALDMERRAKGEQFRILDKAKKPEKPVSPDVRKLLLIFIAAGLGSGVGIAFLFDFMDNSLKRAEDVEPLMGIPVLATIPKVYNQKDRMKRKLNRMLSIASLMVAGVLLSAFAILATKGVDPTLDIIRRFVGKKF